MTNQMKTILKVSLIGSMCSLLVALIAFFVNGIGYLYTYSYILLTFNLLVTCLLLIMYINMKMEERAFKQRIAYYKLLKELKDKAILDFYNKFGLQPQYDKNGRLLTPDEVLGILTSLDKDGKLDPSIYEQLGILPRFDENGKEIPTIIVLKHLIRSIKRQGLKDIKKLNGLYAKGTKVAKQEIKKDNKKTIKKGGAEKKDKGGKKKKESKVGEEIMPEAQEQKGKKKENPTKKAEKKLEEEGNQKSPKLQAQNQTGPPVIIKVKKADFNTSGDEYLKRLYAKQPSQQQNSSSQPQTSKPQVEEGECTPE